MHLHRYEQIWLLFGGSALVVFLIVLAVSAFSFGLTPPGDAQMANAQEVKVAPPLDRPGVIAVDPNSFDVVMTAEMFGYNPSIIEIPAGATVRFKVSSKDVVHGFSIPGTNVNMMVVPGHVNALTQTFDRPGEYLILCNEFCGPGHQFMAATLVVK